ncbi:MAG: heme o synthase [Verrucomicrobia bacterium]|nr:heme o synthase [Verrucomicrobiota bacterium]
MISAYIELTKPRILLMVLVTTALGFFLGAQGEGDLALLAWTLFGTGLSVGGSGALNQYLERDTDAVMERTKGRPLPSGVLLPFHALAFGTLAVLTGVLVLLWRVNLLTAFLVLLAAFLYVLVYTPMKKLTWFHTSVGAIPGAIPPMAGFASAAGSLDVGAWILFGVLFTWQHPHFYSIAWMLRDDYAKASVRVLPLVDPTGNRTRRQVALHLLVLLVLSVLPSVLGLSGAVYLVGTALLGCWMLWVGYGFIKETNHHSARRLLKASVLYLPLWLCLTVGDMIL